MKIRSVFTAVTFGVPLLVGSAYAGDTYQSSVIESPPAANSTNFHLTKPGKMKITPSKLPGTSLVVQLILSGVDCDPNNDGGKPGKCGSVATPEDAVLDMSVRQYILPPTGADMMHVAGVPIEFVKGKAVFSATGKNKADGSQVFGVLVAAFLDQPVGVHVTYVRAEGTDPTNAFTGCGIVPLPAVNTCLDGGEFAIAGMTTGS
jgi:hypothetical protein